MGSACFEFQIMENVRQHLFLFYEIIKYCPTNIKYTAIFSLQVLVKSLYIVLTVQT
jgi:hypothetical protein